MRVNITVDSASLSDHLRQMGERIANPFAGDAGSAAVRILRHGPGSADDAFQRGVEFGLGGDRSWGGARPFGSYEGGSPPLNKSGGLRADWTGVGAGSTESITPTSVSIGVDADINPRAGVFQSYGPTVVRARNRTARGGRLSMQLFLGLTYNVWLSARRLLAGLTIAPRRVGIGTEVVDRMIHMLEHSIVTGESNSQGVS
jgi:hypothetical protein